MIISVIAAVAKNRVIGKDGRLPWHISADLKYFKKTTMGHPIVMGRKTYESIGKALPGRTNIILTRDEDFRSPADCIIAHSVAAAVSFAVSRNFQEVFFIGGASVFEQVLPVADKIYLTSISHEFDGNAFFPELDLKDWILLDREELKENQDIPYDLAFEVYGRRRT